MKKVALLFVLIALVDGILVTHAKTPVVPQTSTTTSSLPIPATAVGANCPAPVAGVTNYCFAGDMLKVSPNGAAYVVIWPAGGAATPILTLNGVTKTLPASFTITASAPNVSGPTITVPVVSGPAIVAQ